MSSIVNKNQCLMQFSDAMAIKVHSSCKIDDVKCISEMYAKAALGDNRFET